MTSPLRISAVLPCFEEIDVLPAVIEVMEHSLRASASDGWEVVLVASLSAADGTPQLARRLASEREGLRLVLQAEDDPGYGRALALGIAAARLPWLLLTDADGQFDHGDLGRLAELAGQAQVVVGRREDRRDSPARRVASRIYTTVVTRLLGLDGISDLDCAFKLMRRDCIGTEPLRCRTGVINAEILKRAAGRGARIAEVPVTHRPRRGSRSRFETGPGLPRPAEMLRMAGDLAALMGRHLLGGNHL